MANPVTYVPPLAPQVTASQPVTSSPTSLPSPVTSPAVVGGTQPPFTSEISAQLDPVTGVDPTRVDVIGDDPAVESVVRYSVTLKAYDANFEGYLRQGKQIIRDCAASAEASRLKFTSDRIYEVRGSLAGLRVYRDPPTGRRDYLDVLHDAQKCDEALGYIAFAINKGLPVTVGVNELGERTLRADGSLANDGITDHYLLIVGYELALTGSVWRIARLDAMDNAPGPMPQYPTPEERQWRFPWFDVERDSGGRIVSVSKPASAAGGAAGSRYQLTLVKVYEKHVGAVRPRLPMSAWKL